MNIAHTNGMVRWRLRETMDGEGITRYALQKATGIAMNTIRAMYEGSTERPELTNLDKIVVALRGLTGKPLTLTDILEWVEISPED